MENMENEKIPEMEMRNKPPGFNWGQIVLAMCVVVALLLAGWNAFSIMGTTEDLNAEDSDLMSEIEAVDSTLKTSIHTLDNETNGRINTLSNEISDVDDRLTQENEDLIGMIESINSTLQSEMGILQNEIAILKENNSILEANTIMLEENITLLNNDIDSMRIDIQSLQNQVDDLENQVDSLENLVDKHLTPIISMNWIENQDNEGNYTGNVLRISNGYPPELSEVIIVYIQGTNIVSDFLDDIETMGLTVGAMTMSFNDNDGNDILGAADTFSLTGVHPGDFIHFSYEPTCLETCLGLTGEMYSTTF